MSPKAHFDISPEKEATTSRFFYRQFFVKPSAVTKKDANLNGKTAIITGANVGLGLQTARQLLDLGLSKLVMAVRNIETGEAARVQLLGEESRYKSCEIEVWNLDLASYESVTAFTERVKSLKHLDIVVLNAALYKITETFNPSTGFDEDVQVNYLSNMLLMVLLIPVLAKNAAASPARLVLVSSDASTMVKFAERTSVPLLEAFKKKTKNWSMQERYGTSKLLGQLFLTELVQRVPSSAVTICAANPGFCYGSSLGREGNGTWAGFFVGIITRIVGRAPAVGARSIVRAAVGFDEAVHGQYIEDGLIRPMAPLIYQPEGEEISKRLWEETMAELSFAGVREIVGQFSK